MYFHSEYSIFTIKWLSKITYGKCPKILDIKMAYANSADPDQTAPEEAVWSRFTLFAIPLGIPIGLTGP